MSSPTELLSPFPAEPSGDSAENEPAATVTYMKKPTGLIPLSQRALPPLWMTLAQGLRALWTDAAC